MSVKEIEEAMNKGVLYFGIKQCLKHKKELKSVFISKDARESTVNLLEKEGIEFVVLKTKNDIAKQLNLDFESEVFSIK